MLAYGHDTMPDAIHYETHTPMFVSRTIDDVGACGTGTHAMKIVDR